MKEIGTIFLYPDLVLAGVRMSILRNMIAIVKNHLKPNIQRVGVTMNNDFLKIIFLMSKLSVS